MKIYKSLLLLLLTILLSGCSNGAINESVIASEKTLPSDFYENAFEREATPNFPYMVRKAVSRAEFEQTWNLYGFEGKIPKVDFDEKSALFIGVIESGSCPYELGDIKWSSDNKTMTVPLSEPESDCTTDATPRTFVLQIDKENAETIENVVIVQSGFETEISVGK